MKKASLCILMMAFSLTSLAQKERKLIREGNKLYGEDKYVEAEINYRKALDENSKSYEGSFNLGASTYKQEKYEDAANQFELLSKQEADKTTLAKAYHNLGNSLLKNNKLEESIEAYKNALRNNPKDEDTRYNLAYAQKMLQQKQQQQQKKQENKDDQKDQQKQQKQDQQQKKKEQEQQKKKEQNQQNQQQEQQPRPDKISKEDAKRLLEALKNEELKVQEKLKKKKKMTKVKIEKDW